MNLKDVKMGRREGETLELLDIWRYFYSNSKQIAIMITIFSVCSGLVWKIYAEEKIDKQIESKIKPLQAKVIKIEKSQREIEFNTKQILLILTKTTDTNIIKQVISETNKFRPDNTSNSITGDN